MLVQFCLLFFEDIHKAAYLFRNGKPTWIKTSKRTRCSVELHKVAVFPRCRYVSGMHYGREGELDCGNKNEIKTPEPFSFCVLCKSWGGNNQIN